MEKEREDRLLHAYKLYEEKKYEEVASIMEDFLHDDDPRACYLIGIMCLDGNGYEQDIDIAGTYFEKGANQGDTRCYFELGKIFEEGLGVTKSMLKAALYFKDGAELGDDECLKRAENIINTPEKYQQFLKELFESNLKEAENGDPGAFCALGNRYLYGEGVEKDEKKGLEYMNKALELGYTPALKGLGDYYYNKYPARYKEAAIWYQKCLDHGIDDEQVITRLMYSYRESGDYQSALKITQLGVERDNVHCLVQLGYFYDEGKYLPLDYKKANELYRKAVSKGNAHAAFNLGMSYLNGNGVQVDISYAISYFIRAAEHGDYEAAIKLVRIYSADEYNRYSPELAEKYQEMARKIKQNNG